MPLVRFRRVIIAAALIVAFACPAGARGDAVSDWNIAANTAIFSTGPTAHAAVLSTAMVQGAVYDAVNAIAGGYHPYLPTPAADPTYSQDAAAATAAFRVVASLVPVGNRVRARVGPLTAEITTDSSERLGLQVGGTAVASFKATATRLLPESLSR